MAKRSLVAELRNELVEAERRANALRAALGALTGIQAASAPAGRRGRRASTRTAAPRKKRRISAAGRRRISEAQKARWAKQKAQKR
jgi:hypothetical protein